MLNARLEETVTRHYQFEKNQLEATPRQGDYDSHSYWLGATDGARRIILDIANEMYPRPEQRRAFLKRVFG